MERSTLQPRWWLNYALGGALILVAIIVGAIAYFKELKPRLTETQQVVERQFTFSLSCYVQEPIVGVYKRWLTSDFKKSHPEVNKFAQLWVYEIACVMPEDTEIRSVTTDITPMVNPPTPGLHFITVADTAPVAVMDWLYQFQGDGPQGEYFESYRRLVPHKFGPMEVYELYLRSQYQNGQLLMNFVCHEELDTSYKPFYLCSSD